MATRAGPRKIPPKGEVKLDVGTLSPKQWQFMDSKYRYTAYGGARGGGKTHVLIRKAIAGALGHEKIKILIIRRTYPELEATIIRPMIELINTATVDGRPAGEQIAVYNGTMRLLTFVNGSTIKFGHLQSMNAITEYQGQEYDWIFIDEATQFTEAQFRTLGACLRGSTEIPRRMYLTCNPGGIGHMWVKRLFISKVYRGGERAEDYTFIPATVDDNPQLLKKLAKLLRRFAVFTFIIAPKLSFKSTWKKPPHWDGSNQNLERSLIRFARFAGAPAIPGRREARSPCAPRTRTRCGDSRPDRRGCRGRGRTRWRRAYSG